MDYEDQREDLMKVRNIKSVGRLHRALVAEEHARVFPQPRPPTEDMSDKADPLTKLKDDLTDQLRPASPNTPDPKTTNVPDTDSATLTHSRYVLILGEIDREDDNNIWIRYKSGNTKNIQKKWHGIYRHNRGIIIQGYWLNKRYEDDDPFEDWEELPSSWRRTLAERYPGTGTEYQTTAGPH